MSVDAPEQFGRRVDAVFGALDGIAQSSGVPGFSQTSTPSSQWSITRQQVYRAGNEKGDSSEEEDEDKNAQQQPEGLLNTMLDAQDGNVQLDQLGNVIQPSLAFCQALDNEQEYDDADAVAGTSLRGDSDPADMMPSRLTEVLDDNVFDQRMRSHQSAEPTSAQSGASSMDIDGPAAAAQGKQQDSWTMGDRARQGAHRRPPLSGRKPGRGLGQSRVPLHVQHPEKYTCYILDEPLLVGGGDKASGISSQAEQEQAARAASSAALAAQQQAQDQESTEPLLAFGAGIQFRPSKKARQQGSPALATVPGTAATSKSQHNMEDDGDSDEEAEIPVKKSLPVLASCMDDDFGEDPQAVIPTKPRRRQYRVKAL